MRKLLQNVFTTSAKRFNNFVVDKRQAVATPSRTHPRLRNVWREPNRQQRRNTCDESSEWEMHEDEWKKKKFCPYLRLALCVSFCISDTRKKFSFWVWPDFKFIFFVEFYFVSPPKFYSLRKRAKFGEIGISPKVCVLAVPQSNRNPESEKEEKNPSPCSRTPRVNFPAHTLTHTDIPCSRQ